MSEHTHQTHHVIPVKVYLACFGALMALTAVTVAVAYVNLDLGAVPLKDRKSTRLNSSHIQKSRMPSSA